MEPRKATKSQQECIHSNPCHVTCKSIRHQGTFRSLPFGFSWTVQASSTKLLPVSNGFHWIQLLNASVAWIVRHPSVVLVVFVWQHTYSSHACTYQALKHTRVLRPAPCHPNRVCRVRLLPRPNQIQRGPLDLSVLRHVHVYHALTGPSSCPSRVIYRRRRCRSQSLPYQHGGHPDWILRDCATHLAQLFFFEDLFAIVVHRLKKSKILRRGETEQVAIRAYSKRKKWVEREPFKCRNTSETMMLNHPPRIPVVHTQKRLGRRSTYIYIHEHTWLMDFCVKVGKFHVSRWEASRQKWILNSSSLGKLYLDISLLFSTW